MRLFLLVVLLLGVPAAAAAQQATPAAGIPGVLAVVGRTCERAGVADTGTAQLGFLATSFTSEGAASAGVPALADRLPNFPAEDGLRETSAPDLGDESAAYTGVAADERPRIELALVVVRVGRVVHVWLAAGVGNQPLADLTAVAEPFFADGGGAAYGDDPSALKAVLPGLDDLPPGFALADEETRFGTPTAR